MSFFENVRNKFLCFVYCISFSLNVKKNGRRNRFLLDLDSNWKIFLWLLWCGHWLRIIPLLYPTAMTFYYTCTTDPKWPAPKRQPIRWVAPLGFYIRSKHLDLILSRFTFPSLLCRRQTLLLNPKSFLGALIGHKQRHLHFQTIMLRSVCIRFL